MPERTKYSAENHSAMAMACGLLRHGRLGGGVGRRRSAARWLFDARPPARNARVAAGGKFDVKAVLIDPVLDTMVRRLDDPTAEAVNGMLRDSVCRLTTLLDDLEKRGVPPAKSTDQTRSTPTRPRRGR